MLEDIKTRVTMYRTFGLMEVLRTGIRRLFRGTGFERIARYTRDHLADERFHVSTKLAEGVSYVYGMGVEGDIAEFGTMSGMSAVALASSVNAMEHFFRKDLRAGKRLWLFDSFEGLPEPRFDVDKQSHHVSTGVWGTGTCKGLTSSELEKLISRFLTKANFVIVKGWFKDTVPQIPSDKKFALINIDSDLYESAIDVLNNLFERKMISKGAAIYFDDWNCNAADLQKGERLAFTEVVNRFSIRFTDWGSYGVASNRFIIHDYQ